MRITRLELHDVGPFENAVFEFPSPNPESSGELVLFEGPNGSGKTTLLLSIALALYPDPEENSQQLHRALTGRGGEVKNAAPFFWPDRLRKDPRGQLSLEDNKKIQTAYFRGPDWIARYPNDSIPAGEVMWPTSSQYLAARNGEGLTDWAAYSFSSHQKTPKMRVRGPAPIDEDYLRRALLFGHDFPNRLSELTAQLDEIRRSTDSRAIPGAPPLGQLLSNLDYDRSRAIAYAVKDSTKSGKSRYDAAAHSYEETLSRMERALSEVLDREVEFRFILGEPAPRILFDGQEIPLGLLGEGMRSTFSWLSDLLIQLQLTPWKDKKRSPFDQNFWLLLDEVDQSLHPQMQMKLMPTLRKLFPHARIYATTHSPFVVASAGEGHVFSIEPDRTTHIVRGMQIAQKLEPGQPLERIVSEVFRSPSLFVDAETRSKLAIHEKAILAIRTKAPIDWISFFKDRSWLMERTEEVRTVVAMREVPVRQIIETHLREAHR